SPELTPPPFRFPSLDPACPGLRSFSPMGRSLLGVGAGEKGKERERDVEPGGVTMSNLSPSSGRGWCDKVTRLFFSARFPAFAPGFGRGKDQYQDRRGRDADFDIPIQHPLHSRTTSDTNTYLPSWLALHVSKRPSHCTCPDPRTPRQKKREKQKRTCLVVFL